MPNVNVDSASIADSLTDIGTTAATEQKGGRVASATPQGGTLSSNAPINTTDRDESQAPRTSFRSQFIDSQNREKMSVIGEEYLKVFMEQATAEKLTVTAMPVNGAYVVHNNQYGVGVVFDEAVHRTIGNEFSPRARIISKIFEDPIMVNQLKQLGVTNLTGVLITPDDYGTKEASLAYAAISKIRNYINLALNADAQLSELGNYRLRIVTNPQVVERNMIANSAHGVLPHYMYGLTMEICMDEEAQNRNRRQDKNEDELNWNHFFTVVAMTEFLDYPEDERPKIPVVTITGYEGTYLSIKLLPLVLAASYEIFINQGLWLEPFKNYGSEGRNLGVLYPDLKTGKPTRIQDREELKAFLKAFVGDPNLAVDLRYGCFNYPGFEVLADASLKRLNMEMEEFTDGDIGQISDPVFRQVEYNTGTVADGDKIRDSRAIDYFRIVEDVTDPALRDRFLIYTDQPEDRIRAIAEVGFSNYNGRTNMLNVLYPTTKYILSAEAISQFASIASILDIMRNTTRDNRPVINSDDLRQQGLGLRQGGSIFSNRNATGNASFRRNTVGSIFGDRRRPF